MKKKKVPIRMCIGCMENKPKKELIRVVKNKENEISIDFTGKNLGEGAYICNNPECLKKAQKAKRLEKAFELPIDNTIFEELQKQMEGLNEGS